MKFNNREQLELDLGDERRHPPVRRPRRSGAAPTDTAAQVQLELGDESGGVEEQTKQRR
jgi:hypothetical protein